MSSWLSFPASSQASSPSTSAACAFEKWTVDTWTVDYGPETIHHGSTRIDTDSRSSHKVTKTRRRPMLFSAFSAISAVRFFVPRLRRVNLVPSWLCLVNRELRRGEYTPPIGVVQSPSEIYPHKIVASGLIAWRQSHLQTFRFRPGNPDAAVYAAICRPSRTILRKAFAAGERRQGRPRPNAYAEDRSGEASPLV